MNPEFRRNLWLEITPHRMLSMTLILIGIFYLVYLGSGSELGEPVAQTALMIAVVLCVLWGAVQAADSLVSEVQGGTWENQRMSALTPWQLSWGKLFGGTVFSWYGTLICLVVYLISTEKIIPVSPLKVLVLVILAGLFSQGISLLSVLYVMRKDRSIPRTRASVFAMVGLFVVLPLVQFAAKKGGVVHWYGVELSAVDFTLTSLCVFSGWIVLGIVRAMRCELQMHNSFWLWALFVVWLMVYTSGFPNFSFGNQFEWNMRVSIACATGLALFYLTVFVDAKSPVDVSRLLSALKQGNWYKVQYLLPSWAVVLILTSLVVLASFFLESDDSKRSASLFFLLALLFSLRDLCVLLALNFGVRRKRADIAAVIYLGVLYGLIPSIVIALFAKQLPDQVLFFFYPRASSGIDILLSVAIVSAEVALAFWFMQRRWHENYAVARLQSEEE